MKKAKREALKALAGVLLDNRPVADWRRQADGGFAFYVGVEEVKAIADCLEALEASESKQEPVEDSGAKLFWHNKYGPVKMTGPARAEQKQAAELAALRALREAVLIAPSAWWRFKSGNDWGIYRKMYGEIVAALEGLAELERKP